jgi:hypothetical protein
VQRNLVESALKQWNARGRGGTKFHVTPVSLPSDGLREADEVRTEILPSVPANKRTIRGMRSPGLT